MEPNEKTLSWPKDDCLDKLIENGEIDEVGLLDLVFFEEILRQKKIPVNAHFS